MGTFWDVLGIKPTTDTDKIRKSYSALIKVHNPEDDPEEFKKINAAYKAAVNFARNFTAMGVTDEQLSITDVRPDGSFGVHIESKDGKPFVPKNANGVALPAEPEQEDKASPDIEKVFDFDQIDSSVVKDLTQDEINKMSGMITVVPGFNVADSKTAREIKSYLYDELNIVDDMARRAKPEETGNMIDDAIAIAKAFIERGKFIGEKLLWQIYFLSPMVISLNFNLFFYRRLEMLINNACLHPRIVFAISDAHPNLPRVYIMKKDKPENDIARVDFLSKVPFRYIEGEYPDLDSIMKKEDPEEVKKLIKFLENIPVNLYGMLMPAFPPADNQRIQDAGLAFKIILTAPYCKDMVNNRLLWKLYFRGKLISPVIHKQFIHTAWTGLTMERKIPKDTLKIIKKEMSFSETVFLRRKKDDKDWYYLKMLNNDITPYARNEKEKKMQAMELFGLTLGIAIGLLLLLLQNLLGG